VALPRDQRLNRRESNWLEALGTMRRDRRFRQIMLASFFVAFVFMQMSSTFGVQVTHLGFSAATYGALISMNGALVVLCELPLTTITRRFPTRRVLAVGYLLIGLGFALNAFARTVPELAVCIIIFTLGEMVAMAVSTAFVSSLAPPHLRGRYLGVYGLNWALALIIAPGLGMKLLSCAPTVLWVGCGVLGLLGAIIISFEVKATSNLAVLGGIVKPATAD